MLKLPIPVPVLTCLHFENLFRNSVCHHIFEVPWTLSIFQNGKKAEYRPTQSFCITVIVLMHVCCVFIKPFLILIEKSYNNNKQ